MSDYVLFSNIGTTDPIRHEYDGPFLHIIRKYKPKKAYIFLTKEMCDIDEKYNAYERAAKVIDKDIEIVKIRHEEIDEPNDFLVFDKHYEKILDEIVRENPKLEVLINISSGTPQMICSLYNITANSDKPFKLIQVITPIKKGHRGDHTNDFTNIESLVLNTYDNICTENEGIENRCYEKKPTNIRKQTIEKVIEEHIKIYDYEGAYQASNEAKDLLNEEVLENLVFLKERNRLNFNKLDKGLLPIETTKDRDIFEYILYLQNKLKRNEILEFSRGISPILTDLFEVYLKEIYKTDIKQYCHKNKLSKDSMPIDVKKVYDATFNGEYRTADLSSKNIEPYLFYFANKENNTKLIEILKHLKEFEKHFRNIAAHEIASINDEEIKKHMKKKFNKEIGVNHILSYLKYLFEVSFNKKYKKQQIDWNSYDKVNELIVEKMKGDRGENSGELSESYN